MITPASLYASANALAPHYEHFRVADRLLLTGHSHQAWPDCGFEAQKQAWLDAAHHVDDKWDEAFERADRVRAGFARWLGSPGAPDDGDYALGSNTHELVVRFLSALPLSNRPRLVTTEGEFHSIRRQLDRLSEEGLEIVRVPVDPIDTLAERVVGEVDDRTAAALVSAVLFRDARIVPGLSAALEGCERVGAELLVDAYHALAAIPFSLAELGLERAFVVGGGYKYCQLGEGNCFLRIPPGGDWRPAITGWFAEFGALTEPGRSHEVPYGPGHERFAGSTYDPTSHYRAAAVFDFFEEFGLSAELLREVSRHQVRELARMFDELDADPAEITRDRSLPLASIGGFLSLKTPYARHLQDRLRARGMLTDHRDGLLRLGPAPYLGDNQLEQAIETLGEVVRARARGRATS